MKRDAKRVFLDKLELLAVDLYRRGDSCSHGEPWKSQRKFLWGFCTAGLEISLVTQKEIQEIINKSHLTVFGESRAARKRRFQTLLSESGETDWDVFDAPTFERKSNLE